MEARPRTLSQSLTIQIAFHRRVELRNPSDVRVCFTTVISTKQVFTTSQTILFNVSAASKVFLATRRFSSDDFTESADAPGTIDSTDFTDSPGSAAVPVAIGATVLPAADSPDHIDSTGTAGSRIAALDPADSVRFAGIALFAAVAVAVANSADSKSSTGFTGTAAAVDIAVTAPAQGY
ncbi:hypothetical protein F4774DRAFT_409166 [Daldinia eschscholtzii]|nr:hypothetical protein F4774DRAFT_409166 [Daldinia eschscholtzii]